MIRQGLRFGMVGSAAALLHLLVVVALVETAGQAPLVANMAGFALAFLLSYAGHRHYTFASSGAQHGLALPRFLLVALAGWGLNQGLFALLLQWTSLPYPVALLAVLGLVAGLTFLLGRHWVFSAG